MHKILIADDSLTIQKVIKITLASEPFELIECLTSAELIQKLNSSSPEIVLLDFNLSEDRTGYELAKDILSLVPGAKILMLFGTFDKIDESLLNDCGVEFRLVKPFDGAKFINLCKLIASDMDKKEISNSSLDEVNIPDPIDENGWIMDSPSSDLDEDFSMERSIIDEKTERIDLDSLKASVDDWGIDIPSIIGSDEFKNSSVPPVIDNLSVAVLPSDDDLEFPDIASDSKPNLVSLSDVEVKEEFSVDSFTDTIDNKQKINDLVAAIEDEIDEENLWSADEQDSFVEIEEEELPHILPHALSEVKSTIPNTIDQKEYDSFADLDYEADAPDDFPQDVMDEVTYSKRRSEKPIISDNQLEEIVREKLGPMVESLVREYCQTNIERIAWEVIPDLAENLIKKEIEKITNSILES